MSDENTRRGPDAERARTFIELVDRVLDETGRTWRALVLAAAMSLPIGTVALVVWLLDLHPLLLASVAGPAIGLLVNRRRLRWARTWKRMSEHKGDGEAGEGITAAEE